MSPCRCRSGKIARQDVTDEQTKGEAIMKLLVRNRVKDVSHWLRVFRSQDEAARAAGLTVLDIWRSVDEVDQVYFLLDVKDRVRAEAFMATPEAEATGREAGVIDGEFHFLDGLDE
jgi:hypothetical protein